MVHEMPEFANLVANAQSTQKQFWCDIFTRNGPVFDTRNRVYQGSPDPLLMMGLTRVQRSEAYGRAPDVSKVVPLKKPQKVNLLAIAAPKLYGNEKSEQLDLKTAKDIFNTLVAGFTLVEQEVPNALIHSGKLGCGAFYNDITLVFLLHHLAACYTGLELNIHGYSDTESAHALNLWNNLAPQLDGKTLNECLQMIVAAASR